MPKRRGTDGRLWIRLWEFDAEGVWLGYQRVEVTDQSAALPATCTTLAPGNPAYGPPEAPASEGDDTYASGYPDVFSARIPDLRGGVVRFINASWSEQGNPFGPPLYIASGRYYQAWLYPNLTPPERDAFELGYEGPTLVWYYLGSLLCVSAGVAMMIPGAQPVTLEFQTDGSFRGPNELGDREEPGYPPPPLPPALAPASIFERFPPEDLSDYGYNPPLPPVRDPTEHPRPGYEPPPEDWPF